MGQGTVSSLCLPLKVKQQRWRDVLTSWRLCLCPQVRSRTGAEWLMPGTSAASGPSCEASSPLNLWNMATPTQTQVVANVKLYAICIYLIQYNGIQFNVCESMCSSDHMLHFLPLDFCVLRYLLRPRDRGTGAIQEVYWRSSHPGWSWSLWNAYERQLGLPGEEQH